MLKDVKVPWSQVHADLCSRCWLAVGQVGRTFLQDPLTNKGRCTALLNPLDWHGQSSAQAHDGRCTQLPQPAASGIHIPMQEECNKPYCLKVRASHTSAQAFHSHQAFFVQQLAVKGKGRGGVIDASAAWATMCVTSPRCATHPWRKDALTHPACPPPGRNPGLC